MTRTPRAIAAPTLIALPLLVLLPAPGALAQEAIHTGAATQPSPGHTIIRQQFTYHRLRDDPTGLDRSVDQFLSSTIISHGLSSDLSLSLRAPFFHREVDAPEPGDRREFTKLDDPSATLKWRFIRHDTGPIDTFRAALLAGVVTGSWDPYIGVVATAIRGRHGLTLQGQWLFTTDSERRPLFPGDAAADLFRADAAYVFRVSPAEYGADTKAAFYGVMEVNSFAETNGDHEVFLSPGILYEAERFAFEAGVQVPVSQALDHRPETSFSLTFGLRFLF